MIRLGVAMIGLLVGCLLGWLVSTWVYPWDEIALTTVGPEHVEHLFQFLGLALGGSIGFFAGAWVALRWLPDEVPVLPEPPKERDPRKVEDNLG